jgi:hypothetical protein
MSSRTDRPASRVRALRGAPATACAAAALAAGAEKIATITTT